MKVVLHVRACREWLGAPGEGRLADSAGQGHVDPGQPPSVHAQHARLLPCAGRLWFLHLLGPQGGNLACPMMTHLALLGRSTVVLG